MTLIIKMNIVLCVIRFIRNMKINRIDLCVHKLPVV